MAKLEMQRFQLVSLNRERKRIMEFLQKREAVEITNVETVSNFSKVDVDRSISMFEKSCALAESALTILNEAAPEKTSMLSSLNGRRQITESEYASMVSDGDITLKKCNSIVSMHKKIMDNKLQIQRVDLMMDNLTPWLGLDIPMQYNGTKNTKALIGYFPRETTLEDINSEIAEAAPELELYEAEVVGSFKGQTCVVVLCHKSVAEKLEQILRSIGFTKPSDPTKHPPKVRMERLKEEKQRLEEEIGELEHQISENADIRDDIKFAADYYRMRIDKYEALKKLAVSKHAFVLEGYVIKMYAEKLCKELTSRFDVAVELTDPAENEEVPVVFKNNGFVSPVEPITEMFAMPRRDEIDPNPAMSFFYYMLFGLMLADAIYGILLVVATWIIMRKYTLEPRMKKTMKMFFYCGISTTIWGIVFGSWFGDVVTIVSTNFFGKTVTIPPLWFSPLEDPMKMLYFSMAIGLIHIFTGMGCGFYTLWKNGRRLDALYDVGFWYMILVGAIGALLGSMVGFPQPVVIVCGALAVIGVVGIIFTAGRESKSIFKRLAKGLYAVYNVTGYLSDVLSYSRLLALGLATSVISSVINTMGAMMGDSVVGMILFMVVFLLGHVLNLAINILGAYVHCNRLQFVEFFGKFYEGGGKAFEPLGVNTKYFKFKEEN